MNINVYRFRSRLSVSEISKLLATSVKQPEKGYQLHRSVQSQVEGSFYFRRERETRVLNPEGVEEVYSVVSYEWFHFTIDAENESLILVDSPRDVRIFMAAFSALLGFQATIENWHSDLLSLIEMVKASPNFSDLVTIDIDQIQIEPNVVCSVTLRGKNDVSRLIDRVTLGSPRFKVRRFSFEMKVGRHLALVEVGASGRFRWATSHGSEVRAKLLEIVDQQLKADTAKGI